MHIKVNVYANSHTNMHSHTSLTLVYCGSESPLLQWVITYKVCVRVSAWVRELFQLQINLEAPLPDHRVEEWTVTGERKGSERIKKQEMWKPSGKRKTSLAKSQRHKGRQEVVMTHWLLKTKAEKQTGIPMQGTRCEMKGGGGVWGKERVERGQL